MSQCIECYSNTQLDQAEDGSPEIDLGSLLLGMGIMYGIVEIVNLATTGRFLWTEKLLTFMVKGAKGVKSLYSEVSAAIKE